MSPQKISFQARVGRSIRSDLIRAMPGQWQLTKLAGAYVNGNGRCLNVSSERRDATNRPRTPRPAERSTANVERRASQHKLYRREAFDSLPWTSLANWSPRRNANSDALRYPPLHAAVSRARN